MKKITIALVLLALISGCGKKEFVESANKRDDGSFSISLHSSDNKRYFMRQDLGQKIYYTYSDTTLDTETQRISYNSKDDSFDVVVKEQESWSVVCSIDYSEVEDFDADDSKCDKEQGDLVQKLKVSFDGSLKEIKLQHDEVLDRLNEIEKKQD